MDDEAEGRKMGCRQTMENDDQRDNKRQCDGI